MNHGVHKISSDKSFGVLLDMSNGYKVRVYESCQGDSAICSGTVVQPVDPSFTMSADSADQATTWIRTNVLRSRLPKSRIYQICPMIGNPEPIRSVAAGLDDSFVRVFLDTASGFSGELRRVRDLEAHSDAAQETLTQQAA